MNACRTTGQRGVEERRTVEYSDFWGREHLSQMVVHTAHHQDVSSSCVSCLPYLCLSLRSPGVQSVFYGIPEGQKDFGRLLLSCFNTTERSHSSLQCSHLPTAHGPLGETHVIFFIFVASYLFLFTQIPDSSSSLNKMVW